MIGREKQSPRKRRILRACRTTNPLKVDGAQEKETDAKEITEWKELLERQVDGDESKEASSSC